MNFPKGSKEAKIFSGYPLFKNNNLLRGIILTVAIDQGVIYMFYNYVPTIIQMFAGTTIIYSIASTLFKVFSTLGSYFAKYFNSSQIMIGNALLEMTIFLSLLLKNPWVTVYGDSVIAFSNALLGLVWMNALREGAGDKNLGSIMGIDELFSNTSRIFSISVAGYLYTIGIFAVPLAGISILLVELLFVKKYKEMRNVKI